MPKTMKKNCLSLILGCLWIQTGNLFADESLLKQSAQLFQEVVAPAFEKSCLNCHNDSKARGGLSLATKAGLLKGSENGAVIEPGKAEESRIYEVLLGDKPEMPQKAQPLDSKTVKAVGEWIRTGAVWPDSTKLTDKSEGGQSVPLWSLQPIQNPKIPESPQSQKSWSRNAIDRFIAKDHVSHGFKPAPEADRRTLVRRLYFDLTGLPPSPEDVERFQHDTHPKAYERLVDRLLSSPSYGERWARHWLDIVHYGETHGYDKDKPRPNAWPYRDYVISAFNQDKPYSKFIQEQIAGDVLFPDSPDAVKALGLLSAGPWDFIGHAEVPESKTDGKIARHLDRDDMVGTTVGSLMSLTIQCAQCHDHKFDPLLQSDYYRLQAVFAAVDRADKPYFQSPQNQLKYNRLQHQKLTLLRRLPILEQEIRVAAGPKLDQIEARIASAKLAVGQKDHPQYGYHSQIATDQKVEKWVQLDLEKPSSVKKIVLSPASDNFNNIGPGFGFPLRYRVEIASGQGLDDIKVIVADFTAKDLINPGIKPQTIEISTGNVVKSIRITATKLAPRQNDYIFALAEMSVFDDKGQNIALKGKLTALDSIEAPVRWQIKNLTDGIAPAVLSDYESNARELTDLERIKTDLIQKTVSSKVIDERNYVASELQSIELQLKSLPKAELVYAGTVHQGGGAFSGTGASGGVPRPIFKLPRGDVKNPLEKVEPGAIKVLKFAPSEFQLEDSADESQRRVTLAEWMTHRDNPLFWRSIVNRVWQYHFGQGIVDPPGDFGHMGGTPSHPELLDYLATTFRDSGGSFKALHRQIVTSATYRQQSTGPAEFSQRDSNNIHLWRQNRRKLEAEAVRDSLLAVSGQLDHKMGGPSFQDFVVQHPEHSPHYEYYLANPDDPSTHRRSVYRFIVRSQPQPFLTAMDCADPSIRVDKRNESVSAAAALAQWNHGLVLAVSGHLGVRMQSISGDTASKVRWGFQQCLSRPPSSDEVQLLTAYAQKHGFDKLARLLLNLNEFSFVD